MSSPGSPLPLFFKKPEVLRADWHGGLKLLQKIDFGFARSTNAVPVMASEFVQAARFYPLVFAGETPAPVAVLGLTDSNMFIDAEDKWDAGASYIPAYVRRYPFTFIEQPGQEGFILGIDRACSRVSEEGEGAAALFEEGKPTDLTKEALKFCAALQTDHMATKAFAAALVEQNLLIDRQANATLTDGRRYGMQGFKIVDAKAFQALSDAVVLDWHRKGWLALVHSHLASLDRFADLLNRTAKTTDSLN